MIIYYIIEHEHEVCSQRMLPTLPHYYRRERERENQCYLIFIKYSCGDM